jgi:predicted nucleic acid-binding protein
MKLLIDTNVILDALMHRQPWAKSAQDIILAIAEEKAEGFVTANSFADIHYILHKQLRDKDQTKQALLGLLVIINVLDVTGSDCEKAFDLPMSDYEDALLAQCAKRHKINRIISRNLKDFKGSPVEAVEPDDIIKTF